MGSCSSSNFVLKGGIKSWSSKSLLRVFPLVPVGFLGKKLVRLFAVCRDVARTRVQVAYLDRLGSVSILLSVAYVLVLSLGPKLKTALWALFISTCRDACDFSVQPCRIGRQYEI